MNNPPLVLLAIDGGSNTIKSYLEIKQREKKRELVYIKIREAGKRQRREETKVPWRYRSHPLKLNKNILIYKFVVPIKIILVG